MKINKILNQMQMPYVEAVSNYIKGKRVPFHMKLSPNFFITSKEIKGVMSNFKKVLDTISHNL